MGFLFGSRKLDRGEFDKCLNYLEQHYILTTFQEKEAGIYNEALTQHRRSLSSDSHSADEMLRVAERLKKAAHELVRRCKQLPYVPESAGRLHFAWQIVFSDYAAWADAQYAVFAAIAEGETPSAERVRTLFRQQEKSAEKALQEEKNVLKLLQSNGLTPGDIQMLTDRAFAAVQAENWQPGEPGEAQSQRVSARDSFDGRELQAGPQDNRTRWGDRVGATIKLACLSAVVGLAWGLAIGFDLGTGAFWGFIIGGSIVFILSLGLSRYAIGGMMMMLGGLGVIASVIGLVVWLVRRLTG